MGEEPSMLLRQTLAAIKLKDLPAYAQRELGVSEQAADRMYEEALDEDMPKPAMIEKLVEEAQKEASHKVKREGSGWGDALCILLSPVLIHLSACAFSGKQMPEIGRHRNSFGSATASGRGTFTCECQRSSWLYRGGLR